jgi:endonuclease VIII-like 1
MPELAEVKIMSEFINHVSKDKVYNNIIKSPENKNPELFVPKEEFKLSSKTRGKELMLFYDNKRVLMNMGMSGNWVFIKEGEVPKHTHIIFESNCGGKLCMVDFRRFSRWREAYRWSDNRGPCMLTEWDDFVTNLHDSSDRKIFNKPIYELMLDQKYFNGMGNYLRAEILDRCNQNPFVSSREAIKNKEMLKLCKDVVVESYQLGGGQLSQWTNPYFDDKQTFKSWLQCYGKKEKIKDRNGRTFWFDKKFLV